MDHNTIRLIIKDNGHGFDVTEARSSSHRGLMNLTARSAAIGATMTLESEPGRGTRLELQIPTTTEDTHAS